MSPFSLMRRFTEDMDQLFSSVGIGRGMGVPWLGGIERDLLRGSNLGQGLWSPQIDVIQRDNDIVVRADLPGLGPNDVQLNVNDNVLTLEGERRQEQEERKGGIYRSERSYGSFSRSIVLPEGADVDKIKASFNNGVLEVIVPIPQQAARGRRIEIQSSAGGQAAAQKPVH